MVHYGEIEETKFEYLMLLSLGFKPKPCDVFAIYVIRIVICKVFSRMLIFAASLHKFFPISAI